MSLSSRRVKRKQRIQKFECQFIYRYLCKEFFLDEKWARQECKNAKKLDRPKQIALENAFGFFVNTCSRLENFVSLYVTFSNGKKLAKVKKNEASLLYKKKISHWINLDWRKWVLVFWCLLFLLTIFAFWAICLFALLSKKLYHFTYHWNFDAEYFLFICAWESINQYQLSKDNKLVKSKSKLFHKMLSYARRFNCRYKS